MDPFTAIAEPTRRKILEMLSANGSLAATDIYKNFSSTPPAISQHLKVLREANLVRVERRALQRIYFINPEPIKRLERWIKQFATVKEKEHSRLDDRSEEMKADEPLLPFE